MVTITACSCLESWLALETTTALPGLPTDLYLLFPISHHPVLVKSQSFSWITPQKHFRLVLDLPLTSLVALREFLKFFELQLTHLYLEANKTFPNDLVGLLH